MNRVLRLLGIFILAILAVAIVFPLAPLLLPISLLAFWYFNKKKTNARFKRYAKNGMIASGVGLAFWVYIGMTTDPEPEVADLDAIETMAEVETKEIVEEDVEEAETEEERAKREAEDEMRRQLFADSRKSKEARKKQQ